ncbi:LysM peptidoglycan-binding domain-containing protein [Ruegeria arenilitoris]|uniref:LysM peptidoglycan-binding domain-containing protein n=1 Tax=Ruegeria arenilitoris TaxID=1173585 RepID=UPI00148065FD|nr:LysM peptidoglycan-binding domain-containing protein [Ruegeria arenilitoris]
MDAKSGSGRSGAFVWGILAGILAVIGAGGLYLSGVFGPAPQSEQSTTEEAVAESASEETTEPAATPAPSPDAEDSQVVAEPDNADEVQTSTETEEATAPEAEETTATDEQTAQDATVEEQPAEAPPSPEANAAAIAPTLDQIFVEPDGNALLSGKGDPGSQIRILLDGEPIHSFTVDGSGQFAEFVTIPFSEAARGLVLEAGDGTRSAQSDDYLIAALPKPPAPPATDEQVASTDTEAQDETAEQPSVAAAAEGTEVAQAGETVTRAQDEEATSPEATTETKSSESQQVAVLRSGEEGVELVQSPSSEDASPEQVALDTIGYSDAGDVQLSGRVSEGAAVRLYLNNKLVADITPGQDGDWRGEIQEVDPGVYTLRVDEVDTDGTVLSRLETPFKREPVEVLQAAEAQDAVPGADQSTPIRSVTVQKGDTLWAISRERFGDGVLYVRLFDANRDLIRDPDLIYPGQVFTIPE